jgi:hypothetical protein
MIVRCVGVKVASTTPNGLNDGGSSHVLGNNGSRAADVVSA